MADTYNEHTPEKEQKSISILHLPAGTRDVYLKRIQTIPEDKRASCAFHVVRAGDSLESIASSFHGRPAEIATANNLAPDAALTAGAELAVPLASQRLCCARSTTSRAGGTRW